MIKELLLFGDNQLINNKVQSFLGQYSPLSSIRVSLIEEIDFSAIRSDQVLIILNEDIAKLSNVFDEVNPSTTSYIAAKPDESLLKMMNDYQIIGGQRHLYSNDNNDSALNLGAIRFNIGICEPAIRESGLMLLDLNVMRKSEVAHHPFAFPSGLFSEDVSQLCRYGGMSELTKVFCITNITEDLSDLVAQFVWYFAEAACQRYPDHPYFTNTVEEYAVEVTSFDTMLSFYKSKSSGRWWVKIPDIKENKWKSCSYEDYQMACNDSISAELLNIIAIAE
jgi:hypothetical protein